MRKALQRSAQGVDVLARGLAGHRGSGVRRAGGGRLGVMSGTAAAVPRTACRQADSTTAGKNRRRNLCGSGRPVCDGRPDLRLLVHPAMLPGIWRVSVTPRGRIRLAATAQNRWLPARETVRERADATGKQSGLLIYMRFT